MDRSTLNQGLLDPVGGCRPLLPRLRDDNGVTPNPLQKYATASAQVRGTQIVGVAGSLGHGGTRSCWRQFLMPGSVVPAEAARSRLLRGSFLWVRAPGSTSGAGWAGVPVGERCHLVPATGVGILCPRLWRSCVGVVVGATRGAIRGMASLVDPGPWGKDGRRSVRLWDQAYLQSVRLQHG